jgi:hypothetical protein
MGRGNKNRISEKLKKIQNFVQKYFGRQCWAESGRDIFSGGAFGRDFGRKKLSKGTPYLFSQKWQFFYFRSIEPERRLMTVEA